MIGTILRRNSILVVARTLFVHSRVRSRIFVTLLFLLASSCASKGVRIDAPPISLQRLEAIVVENLPNGLRTRSPNGREFYSNYFSPRSRGASPNNQFIRSFAKITILGDRRPYRIEVRVQRDERLADGSFIEIDDDQLTTNQIAEKLKRDLDESLRERNLVDDFRVF